MKDVELALSRGLSGVLSIYIQPETININICGHLRYSNGQNGIKMDAMSPYWGSNQGIF